jgi:peptidoglycan-N-acetylglucosamine deacetylase
VGNHTLTHTVELGTTIDESVIAREIGLNQSLLREYNDQQLFRPYMAGGLLGPGTFSNQAIRYLSDNDYTVVLFNSCPRDWERPDTWPEFAMDDIERHDWTVMIVHDVSAFRGMQQLERFLDDSLTAGVEFVQEFADDCAPIRRGQIAGSFDGLVCGDQPANARPLSLAAVPYIHDLPSIGLPRPSANG